jgi:hypothetical protein
MLGGIEETAASFEARFAPRSYPTGASLVDAYRLLAAILKVANFQDSQITRKMIHRMDDSIAFAFGGFASRLRGLSGLSEGTQRQYRRG